ncbi:hypothetical protein EVAR_34551_1 [Eumeta japonica]|uniref:Uncharacterized protein n=1 Tax=Eumeta variegata TaxID=151549 RepID=A0A4C1X863_EUMVA|nr:hypothetical protein EVAR_34551_1 [Eumeta japonica]
MGYRLKCHRRKNKSKQKKIKKPRITGVDKQKSKRTFFNYSEADLQKALELVKNGSAIAAASDKWIEVMEAKEEEENAEKERKRLIQLKRQEKREQEKVRREKEKETNKD